MNLQNNNEFSAGTGDDSNSKADNQQVTPSIANALVSSRLSFYKQPFRKSDWSWVYDANGNFVFQFKRKYDENGNYEKGCIELEDRIIKSLNSKNQEIIPELKLMIRDAIEIKNHGKLLILIRGWGNLTGIGAHNFPIEKASKIQDDFAAWIIYKLTGEVVTSNGC